MSNPDEQLVGSRAEAIGIWLRLLPARLFAAYGAQDGALRAIASNSAWLLLDRLLRMALALLVGIWVARYLGPGRFGELAYIIAYVAFFQAVANLGVDAIVVRDVSRHHAEAPVVLGTAFALRLAVGVVCWLCALVGMAVSGHRDAQTLLLTALVGAPLVFQAADTADLWFQSQSQSRRTVIAKFAGCLLANGAKIALITMAAPLAAFAAVIALEAAVGALSMFLAYRRFPTMGAWRVEMGQARKLLRECLPFLLSGLSIMVYMRIDQIMLKQMQGERQLGIYAAALQISQAWHVIPLTLMASLAPFIARKKLQGEAQYHDALAKVFRLFGALGLSCSVMTAAASPWLIRLLYGEAYAEAVPVLAIHAFTNCFVFLGTAQSLWLANENAGRIALGKTLLGGVVAILGNSLLLPVLGAEGAAIAALLSFGVSAVFSNALFAPKIMMMQLGWRSADTAR